MFFDVSLDICIFQQELINLESCKILSNHFILILTRQSRLLYLLEFHRILILSILIVFLIMSIGLLSKLLEITRFVCFILNILSHRLWLIILVYSCIMIVIIYVSMIFVEVFHDHRLLNIDSGSLSFFCRASGLSSTLFMTLELGLLI